MRQIKINENQYKSIMSRSFHGEKKKRIEEMLAYHGSKADFDNFSLAYIGTGVGAQEFGYGIYVTFEHEVALGYGGICYTVQIPDIDQGNYIFYNEPIPEDIMEEIYSQLLEINRYEDPETYADEQSCQDFIQELRDVMPATEGRYLMYNIGKYVFEKTQVPMIMRNVGITGFIYNNGKVTNGVMFNSRDIKILNKERLERID